MFEAVENIDPKEPPGSPLQTRIIGTFEVEAEAIEAARAAREEFLLTGRDDYAWWIVREEGAQLARWIADSVSGQEYVLDLRSGQLVEVPGLDE
ncbi:MAG: hypothetical protein KatS3mg011_1278 [Acidimicrobiia bacterium]|nr:MAG: hypothetical protein KatS3mg011_1278 [Acidimicrobiia bacterium]